jgi:hypothetical protein
VHYLELDQFIAPGFLITTHGPHSEQVSVEKMLAETDLVAERLPRRVRAGFAALNGRLRPGRSLCDELACALKLAEIDPTLGSDGTTLEALKAAVSAQAGRPYSNRYSNGLRNTPSGRVDTGRPGWTLNAPRLGETHRIARRQETSRTPCARLGVNRSQVQMLSARP